MTAASCYSIYRTLAVNSITVDYSNVTGCEQCYSHYLNVTGCEQSHSRLQQCDWLRAVLQSITAT